MIPVLQCTFRKCWVNLFKNEPDNKGISILSPNYEFVYLFKRIAKSRRHYFFPNLKVNQHNSTIFSIWESNEILLHFHHFFRKLNDENELIHGELIFVFKYGISWNNIGMVLRPLCTREMQVLALLRKNRTQFLFSECRSQLHDALPGSMPKYIIQPYNWKVNSKLLQMQWRCRGELLNGFWKH